jgi:hypothetical protein
VEADRQTVQDVQVREPVAVELTGDERELLPEVRRSHVVERPVGRQADADPVGRPDGRDPFDHLVQEAIAILNAPAVFVRAMVRRRLEEGVDEIAVGRVGLDAIEPGLLRPLGGSPVVLHDPGDLGRLERPWDLERPLAAGVFGAMSARADATSSAASGCMGAVGRRISPSPFPAIPPRNSKNCVARTIVNGTPPASISPSWWTLARMYPLSVMRSAPTTERATWCPTPAVFSAASRLRVDLSKDSITASSAQEGEFDTSSTTFAPGGGSARVSCR